VQTGEKMNPEDSVVWTFRWRMKAGGRGALRCHMPACKTDDMLNLYAALKNLTRNNLICVWDVYLATARKARGIAAGGVWEIQHRSADLC